MMTITFVNRKEFGKEPSHFRLQWRRAKKSLNGFCNLSILVEFCYDFGILGGDFDILAILGIWDECAVFVFHLSLSFFFLESFAESCFFSFWGGTRKKTYVRTYGKSGGQRGWDLGFPALHRHHSGTGRKDTQNGKRCGN